MKLIYYYYDCIMLHYTMNVLLNVKLHTINSIFQQAIAHTAEAYRSNRNGWKSPYSACEVNK